MEEKVHRKSSMIYITGDTHGYFTRFSAKRLRKAGMELTQEDYIIICGDFGLCWAEDKTFEYHCKNFEEKPYTILWVQGNHENYDMIGKYPLEEWHGGKVRHIIRDKVILLERGQVFEIDGKTFFTFGGASSHDIQGGILDRQTGRLCGHSLLWQLAAGTAQCRDGALRRTGSADRLSGDFGTERKCICGAGTGSDGRRKGSWQGMRMSEFFRIQKKE